MNTKGKVSKVAVCTKCHGFVLACHVDFLDKKTENEFTEFTNEGFIVKLETIDKTKSRNFADYKLCKEKKCKPKFKTSHL